ncbi:MAG: hypothetical protein Kow00124_31170 [Anaerolineae bacterium]
MTENLPPSEQPRRSGMSSSLLIGLALLVLGAFFLLRNTGVVDIFDWLDVGINWWAIFLLIPGALLLFRGVQGISAGEGQAREVRNQVAGGALLLIAGLAFLFNFNNWDFVWPLFLIAIGVAVLLRRA